jgi:2-keto-4-pentenoate hydratase
MVVDEAIEIKWQGLQRGDHAPEALRGKLSLQDAYRVQLGVLEHYKANGETQAGWKIGLTADAIRQSYATTDPAFGFLLQRNAYASGHCFNYADIVNPAIESELCFTLDETLRGPGVTREQALNAVGSVAPSFEVVSLQVKMAEDLPLGIADNVSQWGYVTHTAVTPYPKDLLLGEVTAEVKTDGDVIATLVGADVIDDQLQSLAWLANQLADFGRALEAGQRVITGSFTKPLSIKQGENWETHFSSVGTVSATFA